MNRRRTKRLLHLTVLIAVTATAITLRPREPNLLDHATRRVSVAEWDPSLPYFWTDEDQVLFHKQPKGYEREVHGYVPDDFDIYRYRRSTGSVGLHGELAAVFKKHYTSVRHGQMSVSPDGLWLFCGEGITCRTDGTQVVPHEGGISSTGVVWAADSRHVLDVSFLPSKPAPNGSFSIYDVARVKPVGRYPIPVTYRSNQTTGNTTFTPDLNYEQAVVTEDGYFVAPGRAPEADPPNRTLFRWKLTAPTLETLTMRPPTDMAIMEFAVSPRGDRIAYLVAGAARAPYPDLVYRVFPFIKRPPSIEALWISRLDGSEMQMIGSVTTGHLSALKWLPGYRQVSFIYSNEALYTVRLD